MATTLEYALMAGGSYVDARKPINWFPTPDGWTKSNHQAKDSGFEAISFTNGTEIVISFAGTYDKDFTGDILADAGLALGGGSVQLTQAVDYYLQVRFQPVNATH